MREGLAKQQCNADPFFHGVAEVRLSEALRNTISRGKRFSHHVKTQLEPNLHLPMEIAQMS